MPATRNTAAVTVEGLDVVLRRFTEFSRRLDGLPNRELRDEAGAIAAQMEGPVREAMAGSRAPQAAKVAATVRAKRDRIPVVRIGATIPKLSGMRRGKPNLKSHKGSVAWGVDQGPAGGHRRGRAAGANFYQVARGTHGVSARMDAIGARMLPAYQQALARLMRSWGMI